jgi:hypothetical protein
MILGASDTTEGVTPVGVAPAASPIVYQKKIMLVLPWWKQVSPVTSFCVSQLADRRRTSSMLNFGDAFVAHSRNTCVDAFLQTECDWFLTIDDDMIVPFGNAAWYKTHTRFDDFPEKFLGLNAIDRLVSHNKTLVGALYFGRHHCGPPVYNEGAMNAQEAAYARKAPYDLIKPTKWVGTGCMLVHRKVFEDIEKKFPRLARGANKRGGHWFTSTEASLMERIHALRDRLQNGPLDGQKAYTAMAGLEELIARAKDENSLGVGEDVSFCMRAAAAGHQPYVDMGLVCGHLGHCCYGPRNTRNEKVMSGF